jgi:hypothetical protein
MNKTKIPFPVIMFQVALFSCSNETGSGTTDAYFADTAIEDTGPQDAGPQDAGPNDASADTSGDDGGECTIPDASTIQSCEEAMNVCAYLWGGYCSNPGEICHRGHTCSSFYYDCECRCTECRWYCTHMDCERDAGVDGGADGGPDAGEDAGQGRDASAWPGQATRVGETFVINSGSSVPGVPITPSRWTEVSFDSTNGVFLASWSSLGGVHGRFVSQDGLPLGEPFVIPDPPAAGYCYPDHPRLAFSPDIGAFLAVFREERGDTPDPPPPHTLVQMGRILAYSTGGIPNFLTSSFQVSTGGDINGSGTNPAVAYSTKSREFLVAFMGTGLFAQRVSNAGALLGDVITIAPAGDWDTEPSVAYNHGADEFYVVWQKEVASPNLYSILGRRVKAGTGELPDSPLAIDGPVSAGKRTPEVQFDPARNRYLAVWMSTEAGGAVVKGMFVKTDNTPDGAAFTVSGFATYDGIGLAYNQYTGTYLSTYTHAPGGDNDRTWGVQVNGAGVVGTELQLMTPAANTNYTRVAANPNRAEWLSTASIRFTTTLGQRVGISP